MVPSGRSNWLLVLPADTGFVYSVRGVATSMKLSFSDWEGDCQYGLDLSPVGSLFGNNQTSRM